MIFAKPQPPPDDEPFDENTVVELSGEAKILMNQLLDALSNVVHATVTGPDLANALRSLRERDGVEVDLSSPEQLQMLVKRLAEMKGSDSH